MTISIDRRQFLAGSAALAAASIVPVRVFAQEGSPVAGATPTEDGIDVPVLDVAFTVDGVTVSPAEIAAGTVRMLASSDGTDDQGTLIFRVPDHQDVDDVLALATSDAPPPDWFWTTVFPGGVRNDSHEPSVTEGFVVLDPGTYIVLDDFVKSAVAVTATGEVGAPVGIPATVLVTAEDTMTFTGLEEPVAAGRQLWQLDNGGELHHEITIFSTPEGTTAEDIHAIFEGLFSGTPPAGDPFEGYGDSTMSTPMMSGGRSQWFYLDLAPGPYAAMCAAFDSLESPPHFMMGMIVTFTVA
jgi:hypothetical protein